VHDVTERSNGDHPTPRPWALRGGAAPHVPGSPTELIGNLRALLEDVVRDPTIDRPFVWPGHTGQTTIRAVLHGLGSSGLFRREGQPTRLVLTGSARQFLASGDVEYLMSVFHANVRFMGEALHALGEGSSIAGLNQRASEDYGLRWGSLDQVRRRVCWFRATGLVEYWTNGRVVPTDRGQALLRELVLTAPEQTAPPESRELPPASAMLASRLARLDDGALRSRSRQLGYVAGGTRIDTLQFLVNAAVPVISRGAFVKVAVDEYGIAESSAEQSLGALCLMGFLEQVGPDSFAATDVATEWLASNDPVDLIRVLHLNVALVGETLDAVADATTAGAAAGLLADRYPEIEIGRDGTARRITLLPDVGLVERVGISLRRTPLGDALVATLPLLSTVGTDAQVQPSSAHAEHDGLRELAAELASGCRRGEDEWRRSPHR
jgi:hypothetical protein